MRELRRFGGTPEAVLQSEELMRIYIPILRADLALEEAYRHTAEPPLEIPISAFGGTMDREATPELIEPWAEHTSREFALETIEGDHFFLNSARAFLLRSVSRIISKHLQLPL